MQSVKFAREQELPVYYAGHEIGKRRTDFMVEGKIPVEIKAIRKLENVHLAQAINYLEATSLEIGLLINFGDTRLEFNRVINRGKRSKQ